MRLESQPRRLYEKNALRSVICRVDFSVLTRFDEPGFLGPVQEALSATYPKSMVEQQFGVTFGPGGATSMPASQQWRFQTADEAWNIVIARDFASLETTGYERFEGFRGRFAELIAMLKPLKVSWRERLGLRYINEFRRADAALATDWQGFLNPDLLGIVGGDVLGDGVIQAIEDIRVRVDDGVLAIRHGFLSSEVSSSQDALYLLDLDSYDDAGREFDSGQTLDQVDAYHQQIHEVFEMAITDEMRGYLKVSEEIA
jgi:uncharacterized protein (TIGR04255 family)